MKKQLLKTIIETGRFPTNLHKTLDITELSIDVNNRCNLNCKHCYWGLDELKEDELSLSEINKLIDQAIILGVKVFAFAGKEPFLTDKIISVLAYLKEKKSKHKIIYGVVSNGTLVSKYFGALKELDLDYFDVSLDGTEEVHDAMRGKGVYKKALNVLKELVSNKVAKKVFVSLCYTNKNKSNFVNLMGELCAQGITNVCILPYGHTSKNNQELAITVEDVLVLVDQFKALQTKDNGELLIDLEWYCLPAVKELFEQKILSFDDVIEDSVGNLYVKLAKKRYVKFGLVDFTRFSITADGYLGFVDMKIDNNYWKRAGGSVRQELITELIPKAIKNAVTFYNQNLLKMNGKLVVGEND